MPQKPSPLAARPEALPRITWPLNDLRRTIEPDLPGFTCEALLEVDSTNSELMRRFKAGQLAPTLLVAEQQTAGRGRVGRQWHSVRGDSLTFSLGMMLSPAAWSGLSLAVGVSLAESLDEKRENSGAAAGEGAIASHIGLKWPNDLWLAGQIGGESKLAGVLIETAVWEGMRYAVIGVGINIRPVQMPPGKSGATAAVPPGHLQQLLPLASAADVLLRVVPPLVQTVQSFALFGFEPFQARFAQRDVLAGRCVDLSDGGQGQSHGVTIDGALKVQTESGMVIVAAAEVSVRPARPTGGAASGDAPAC